MTLPSAIASMAEHRRWVGWRWVIMPDGKRDKPPFRGDFPEFHASTTKPNSWVPFSTAAASCAAGKLDGIGYVCADDADRVYWDLDKCRNPVTGEIADWAAAYVEECDTYTEITPSGEGLRIIGTHGGTLRAPIHAAYRLAGGGTGEVFFRAVRFITVTGNRLPGTPDRLSDISGTVLDLLAIAGKAQAANPLPDFGETRGREEALAPIGDVRAALKVIPNNDIHYDEWVRVGLATFSATSGTGEGFEAWQEWSAKSGKHHDAECLRVWQSIRRSPPKRIGFGSLCYMARSVNPLFVAPSWIGTPVPNLDSPAVPFEFDPETGEILTPRPEPQASVQKPGLMTIAQIEAMPPPQWLIEGLLPEKGLIVPYGPPKVGKTFIVLSMALHIAAGKDWFGKAVRQGVVVYIAGEGLGGLALRIKAMRARYELSADIPFFVRPKAVNFRDPNMVAELVALAKDAAAGQPIALVVIDTLARAMPGVDENSAQEVGVVIAHCDAVKEELGCAVAPIHHTGKDQERGMRGSNAIHGAVDTTLRLKAAGDKRVTMINEDQKDGEPAAPMTFVMEEVMAGLRSSLVPVLEEPRSPGRPRGEEPDATELLTRVVIAMAGCREAPLKRLAEAVLGSGTGRSAMTLSTIIPAGEAQAVVLRLGTKRIRIWKRIAGEHKTSPIYVVQEQEESPDDE